MSASSPAAQFAARLLVTIDTECDKSPNWKVSSPVTHRNITEALPAVLQPLFERYGVRPTYLLSPEVLTHPESVRTLKSFRDTELTTHLHGDFLTPQAKRHDMAGADTDDMQWEYGADLERAKMETLTELFRQQVGYQPLSFRAGRFGAGPHTGKILQDLGYLVDSSVTPHVTWTSRKGEKYPDYRGYPEMPYYLGPEGDIARPGAGGLLEVPVTVLAPGALGQAGGPVWFRPWYSDTETLLRAMDAVLDEPPVDGIHRPLMMMFHSVEVLAGASPYPQTEADVERYLGMLEAVFRHAAARGVQACTMAEYARDYAAFRQGRPAADPHSDPDPDPAIRLPQAAIDAAVDRHGAHPWFKYVSAQRGTRWDVVQPCAWVARNVPRTAPVLSVGTGAGMNLLWYAQNGYASLAGTDIDARAIAAGQELAALAGAPIRYAVEDAMAPRAFQGERFGVIEALNCTMYMPQFTLEKLLDRYLPLLAEDGVLLFDFIDAAFDAMPGNQYLSSDAGLPEAQRRPSEYLHRFTPAQVEQTLAAFGLRVRQTFTVPQAIPRHVYAVSRIPT